MPFDLLVNTIIAVGFQGIHLTPLLIGVYMVWRQRTSRRGATVVAQIR
jgi:hypothetical protein